MYSFEYVKKVKTIKTTLIFQNMQLSNKCCVRAIFEVCRNRNFEFLWLSKIIDVDRPIAGPLVWLTLSHSGANVLPKGRFEFILCTLHYTLHAS